RRPHADLGVRRRPPPVCGRPPGPRRPPAPDADGGARHDRAPRRADDGRGVGDLHRDAALARAAGGRSEAAPRGTQAIAREPPTGNGPAIYDALAPLPTAHGPSSPDVKAS